MANFVRRARLLTLAALVLLPGCFTSELWDWAEDEGWVVDAYADQVDGWARETVERPGALDEVFDVRVHWTDGTTSTERVGVACEGAPAALVARARQHAERGEPAAAASLLRLAMSRGLSRRDLVEDDSFTTLRDEPDFAVACAAPVTSPTFFVGAPPSLDPRHDPREGRGHLWLRGTADEVWIRGLQAKDHHEDARGGPLGYVLAVLATPLTLALDVVVFPGQVIFIVLFGR